MRAGLAAFVFLATSFVASRASALEVLRFSWDAPAGCPSADSIRAAAMKNAPGAAVPLEAAAVVVHEDRWTVTLRTRRADQTGERKLEAASCRALADATAVILALALVPPGEAVADPPPSSSSPSAASSPSPSASPSPSPSPSPPPPPATPSPNAEAAAAPSPNQDRASSSRPRGPHSPAIALGAFAATDATTLPAVAIGGGASLAWTPSALRLEATASAWSGQSQTLDQSTAGARFTMTAIGAGGCYALTRGSFELSPCAGGSMSFVSAKGFGATANYDASTRWASFDAGLLARAPITSWLAVRGRVDGLVPFQRPSFEVENEGVVHKPPPLGIRAALGVELNFL